MKDFTGKVAVVTGAGSGIGRALALRLTEGGALVSVCDWDSDGLAETTALCTSAGRTPHGRRLDVRDRAAVADYAKEVVETFGRVNLVINNAGITMFGAIEDSPYEDIEKVMDVDFWGVVNGTKEFLPNLIASGDGHIVNVSSIFGLFGVPTQSSYNAAKFAVRGFTESLRQEMLVARHPVGVTCVHPGGVRTNIVNNAVASNGADMGRMQKIFSTALSPTSPDRAAKTILNGVRRRSPRVLIGLDARLVDGAVRALGSAYQRPFALVAQRFTRILDTPARGVREEITK